MDYSDLPSLVAAYIRKWFPENDLYSRVYSLNAMEYTLQEIGEELGIPPKEVYYFRAEAMRVAREYRKLYFDEGAVYVPGSGKQAPEAQAEHKTTNERQGRVSPWIHI